MMNSDFFPEIFKLAEKNKELCNLPSEEEIEQTYAYGYHLYESGNYKQAKKAFEMLLTFNGVFEKRFWFAFSACMQKLKEYNKALHGWAMTSLLDKNDSLCHFHAAECLISLNQIDEAKKALMQAKIKVNKSNPLFSKIEHLQEIWSS
jgi:type III secretion system low calcium response chaperone LcrH/SycD